MNLTMHIVRKDLFHFRWAIVVWLASFAYHFLDGRVNLSRSPDLQAFFSSTALLTLVVMSIGLIIGIVQADHPDDSSEYWRTRPISAARLLTAKMIVTVALFVAVPMLAVWLKALFSPPVSVEYVREYGMLALALSSVTLSLFATSSVTKKGAHSLLLWAALLFATVTLMELLGRLSPILSRRMATQMSINKTLTLLGLSMAISLAIILNQYLRRRLGVSIALFIAGSVGTAVIGTAWSYYYFYSAH